MNPPTTGQAVTSMIAPRSHVFQALRYIALNINKGPFLAIHLAVVFVFFVPVTWTSLSLCAGLYFIRMFGITAGYHRYFCALRLQNEPALPICPGLVGMQCATKGSSLVGFESSPSSQAFRSRR